MPVVRFIVSPNFFAGCPACRRRWGRIQVMTELLVVTQVATTLSLGNT